ncbi:MAG: hypothetical protein K2X47_04235 [Bdellovibrionales bacterium]|nr:hypothetical protein [Bdellovibrionales bacterium]
MKNRIFSARGGVDLFLVMIGLIFLQAGSEKVMGGEVPGWFAEQFGPTLIGKLPGGLLLSFATIALLEVVVGILAFVTLLKENLFHITLLLSELTFLMLGFGLRLSHKYSEAGQLFNYFALTLLVHVIATKTMKETPNG